MLGRSALVVVWRPHHQAVAKRCHYKLRGVCDPLTDSGFNGLIALALSLEAQLLSISGLTSNYKLYSPLVVSASR